MNLPCLMCSHLPYHAFTISLCSYVSFQHRGSPHIHGLFWDATAPTYTGSDDADVITYINNSMTCSDSAVPPELVNLQRHNHSHTCRKTRRERCRFGFPKPPMPQTVILKPIDPAEDIDLPQCAKNWKTISTLLESFNQGCDMTFAAFLHHIRLSYHEYIAAVRYSIGRPTVFLRRTLSQIRINAYNIHLLKAWRANMDIQFVLDVYACATYIASYLLKSQKGMSELLRTACQEVRDGNLSIKQSLRTIGNKFVNSHEMSAQEACYLLQQLPFRKASGQIIFVNTSPPADRVTLLIPNHVLATLHPDSEDVSQPGLLSYYATRPAEFATLTLAEFATEYDVIHPTKQPRRSQKLAATQLDGFLPEDPSRETENDDADVTDTVASTPHTQSKVRQLRKRKTRKIIRTVHFKKDTHEENHFRELLMLYYPWRDETTDLLGAFPCFKDSYNAKKEILEPIRRTFDMCGDALDTTTEAHEHIEHDNLHPVAPSTQHADNNDAAAEQITDHPTFQYDIGQDIGLPATTNDNTQLPYHEIPDADFYAMAQSLNQEQRVFFDSILHHIKTSSEPFYRFLSGGAGCGKTHVINTLYQALIKFYNRQLTHNPEKQFVLKGAPTGNLYLLFTVCAMVHVLHVFLLMYLRHRPDICFACAVPSLTYMAYMYLPNHFLLHWFVPLWGHKHS